MYKVKEVGALREQYEKIQWADGERGIVGYWCQRILFALCSNKTFGLFTFFSI